MLPAGPLLLVWGNCQAESLRRRLEPLAAAAGLTAAPLPAVHEITAGQRDEVLAALDRVELLVAQPVSDEYRVTGLGTERLAARARSTVTFPVVFLQSWFPCQVYARNADDVVVDAPLTVYHDLRAVLGLPDALDPAGIRAVDAESRAELQRRESGLDVRICDALVGPHAMVTVNHPAGPVVDVLAARVAAAAGLGMPSPGAPTIGPLRSPLERQVLDALGSDAPATGWTRDGRPLTGIAEAQDAFYAAHPDVVADVRVRYADRITQLF